MPPKVSAHQRPRTTIAAAIWCSARQTALVPSDKMSTEVSVDAQKCSTRTRWTLSKATIDPVPAFPHVQPENLRRKALHEAPFAEVSVLGHDGEIVGLGVVPNLAVSTTPQADVSHMSAARVFRAQATDQGRTEIGVKKKRHATEFARRRSRAAANARDARMSSRERSGKSARI